jgi:predicted GNAT superfamily acetyltransferase
MKTNQRIRPATVIDLSEVLRLNQSALPHVSGLTTNRLRSLFEEAVWFHIAEMNGECAGFLIALPSCAKYRSQNFLCFAQRFSNFLYIDRICVSPEYQRRGVASQLYVSVETFAREGQIPLLTCEVNLEPANPASTIFP